MLNVRFEVTSAEVEVKSGTNARGPWQIREQEAHMFKGDDKYPEKVVLALDDGQAPYLPGVYELDEKSLWVGKYKQVQLRVRLKPVAAATLKQAS
ncbi:hypothetical protein D1O90_004951 [Escherichia coli]|nr:hypothetical protein [Escherichia coli]